jgi:hypothetical protein
MSTPKLEQLKAERWRLQMEQHEKAVRDIYTEEEKALQADIDKMRAENSASAPAQILTPIDEQIAKLNASKDPFERGQIVACIKKLRTA